MDITPSTKRNKRNVKIAVILCLVVSFALYALRRTIASPGTLPPEIVVTADSFHIDVQSWAIRCHELAERDGELQCSSPLAIFKLGDSSPRFRSYYAKKQPVEPLGQKEGAVIRTEDDLMRVGRTVDAQFAGWIAGLELSGEWQMTPPRWRERRPLRELENEDGYTFRWRLTRYQEIPCFPSNVVNIQYDGMAGSVYAITAHLGAFDESDYRFTSVDAIRAASEYLDQSLSSETRQEIGAVRSAEQMWVPARTRSERASNTLDQIDLVRGYNVTYGDGRVMILVNGLTNEVVEDSLAALLPRGHQ